MLVSTLSNAHMHTKTLQPSAKLRLHSEVIINGVIVQINVQSRVFLIFALGRTLILGEYILYLETRAVPRNKVAYLSILENKAPSTLIFFIFFLTALLIFISS